MGLNLFPVVVVDMMLPVAGLAWWMLQHGIVLNIKVLLFTHQLLHSIRGITYLCYRAIFQIFKFGKNQVRLLSRISMRSSTFFKVGIFRNHELFPNKLNFQGNALDVVHLCHTPKSNAYIRRQGSLHCSCLSLRWQPKNNPL